MNCKEEFIEFMVRCNVLTGDLNKERASYTLLNTEIITLAISFLLGEHYAQSLIDSMPDGFDVLFGPAYKGISVVATAMSLSSKYGKMWHSA